MHEIVLYVHEIDLLVHESDLSVYESDLSVMKACFRKLTDAYKKQQIKGGRRGLGTVDTRQQISSWVKHWQKRLNKCGWNEGPEDGKKD